MKRHHIRKTLLIICGVLFTAFGISAFFGVPGGHDESHHTVGHNLTHIIAGLLVLDVALVSSARGRRGFCFVFGAVYLLIGMFGVFSGRDSLRIVPGVLEFHLEDDWIQIATGLLFVALGFLKRVPSHSPRHPLAAYLAEQNKGEIMKKLSLLVGAVALGLVGCAHDRDYVRSQDRYYVSEEHPSTVVIDRDGSRTYVREYDRDYRNSPHFQNNMEPRVRGKHAESLGWNTESYYLQRGYRE
jgi:hypothetical protein